MAGKSRISTWSVMRIIVLPCLLLFSIFKKPIFQWIALCVLLAWLVLELGRIVASSIKGRKPWKRSRSKRAKTGPEPESAEVPDNSLMLKVNYRITERLKDTYPDVTWLWTDRPCSDALKRGGTWRISLENADPFNFAEISLRSSGAMSISLMQVIPLYEAENTPEPDGSDLDASELLDRFDVRKWYTEKGERELCGIVEELNTQGFRRLMIRESGEVVIGPSGSERSFGTLASFPPKTSWADLCVLMREDDLQASVDGAQLAVAW